MKNGDEHILIGVLGRTRGVAGAIWVTPRTDFPERFVGLKEIFVKQSGDWQTYQIESARMIDARPVLKFKGVDNKEAAALLTNCAVAVPPEQLAELGDDEYYVFDLIGCVVFGDESGTKLGEITDVRRYPANDVYVIKRPDGSEVFFPAVSDFVNEIDVKNKRIVVGSSGLFDKPADQSKS